MSAAAERLLVELESAVGMYREESVAAAKAEAAHKLARSKRLLQARHSGEAKSDATATAVAESDDTVSDLYSARLINAALADSTKQAILSLRESIGYERSKMADRREADKFHSSHGSA